MTKPLLVELAWILLAAAISFAVAGFYFNREFVFIAGGVSLGASTYQVPPGVFLVSLFLSVCFLLFVVKELRRRYSRKLPSLVIIASGILLIGSISLLSRYFAVIAGYTIYPPLSALMENPDGVEYEWDQRAVTFNNLATIFQLIIGAICVYVGYRLGAVKKTGEAS